MKKYIRNLSARELRNLAWVCVGTAVLIGMALVLSGSIPLPQGFSKPRLYEEPKPWVMELP